MRVNWLDQMVFEPGFHAALDIFLHSESANSNAAAHHAVKQGQGVPFRSVVSCCQIIVVDWLVLALFGSLRRFPPLVRRRIARIRKPSFYPLNYEDSVESTKNRWIG